MALRQLIEGRIDHLDIVPYYGLFDIGNLLRALIDQKNDHVHIRMIGGDCLGTCFKRVVLSGLRRRYDHASLALTDWCQKIQNPHGGAALALGLHMEAAVREDRGQILKIRTAFQRA